MCMYQVSEYGLLSPLASNPTATLTNCQSLFAITFEPVRALTLVACAGQGETRAIQSERSSIFHG